MTMRKLPNLGIDPSMRMIADAYESAMVSIRAEYERGRMKPNEYIRAMYELAEDAEDERRLARHREMMDKCWPDG